VAAETGFRTMAEGSYVDASRHSHTSSLLEPDLRRNDEQRPPPGTALRHPHHTFPASSHRCDAQHLHRD